MSKVIGCAFEELSENEMMAIQGGGPELTITVWSSAPCCISAGSVSLVTIVGTVIYSCVTN